MTRDTTVHHVARHDSLDGALLLVKRVDGWLGAKKVAIARCAEQLHHEAGGGGGGQRPETALGEVFGKTERAG